MFLPDEAETMTAGARLADVLRPGDVVALHGDLGAGKTTFARGLLRRLGLAGEAPSPTFAIVQPYAPPETRIEAWHVDLYRLDSPEEVAELGLDEARAGATLIIEWPERMGSRLWPDTLHLRLAREGQGRRLTWQPPASWGPRWPCI